MKLFSSLKYLLFAVAVCASTESLAGCFACHYVCGSTTGGMSSGYEYYNLSSIQEAETAHLAWVRLYSCVSGGCYPSSHSTYCPTVRGIGRHQPPAIKLRR